MLASLQMSPLKWVSIPERVLSELKSDLPFFSPLDSLFQSLKGF